MEEKKILTPQELALQALKQYIGYQEQPVDIETFLKDDYFLGNAFNEGNRFKIYPKWMDVLNEVYPNEVTSHPFVMLTGGIGLGKTTIFKIMQLYSLYKFLCMKSFTQFAGLANTKKTSWIFCTVKLEYATTYFQELKELMDSSPYFVNKIREMGGQKGFDKKVDFRTASQVKHLISIDAPSILLSEINEATRVDSSGRSLAWRLLDESNNRLHSRYEQIIGMFPQILLDSSSKSSDSPMEQFVREAPFRDQLKVFGYSRWEINNNFGFFIPRAKDGRTQFWVYVGSADVPAFIVDKEELEPSDIPIRADIDLFKKAPIEMLERFKSNLEESIRAIMGISTRGGSSFFSLQNLNPIMKLPQVTEEIITIDEDVQIPIHKYNNLENILNLIPSNQPITIGIDIGTKSDLCGIAIAYVKNWKETDIEEETVYDPEIDVPIVFGLGRAKQGQATSIKRLFNFLVYLSTRFTIIMIYCDGYASVSLLQELAFKNIPSSRYSVESEVEYAVFKNLCINSQVSLPDNSLLKSELICLTRDPKNPKNLNHPQNGKATKDPTTGRFTSAVSKDLADACCRAVLACYQHGRDAVTGNPKANYDQLMGLMDSLYEDIVSEEDKNQYIEQFNSFIGVDY